MTKHLIAGLVVILTFTGLLLRVSRLQGVEGTMGEDQARLALAASGILDTGWPRMPSGRIYLRGLTSAYATAASLAIVGRNDVGARLPNVIIGTLLIPVLFVFGRAVAGVTGGLVLAAFATVQPGLLHWSTEAWTTLPFVVSFITAAYLLYRGYGSDDARLQVAGALLSVIAVLTHELGALLAISVGLTLAVRAAAGDRTWFRGLPSVVALAILLTSLVLFVVLGLALRTGTLAGASSEFAMYFGPSLSASNMQVDLERLKSGYLPLTLAALLTPWFLWQSRAPGPLFLAMTTAVASGTVWFVISKTSDRYGAVLLPLIALLASWTLAQMGRQTFRDGRRMPVGRRHLGAWLVVACFGFSLQRDLRALADAPQPPAQTWLAEMRAHGWTPQDLVFVDNPSIQAFYLGRVDYWAKPEAHERYTFLDGDRFRDVYAGAIRIAGDSDFDALVATHSGRRLWYVGEERKLEVRVGPSTLKRLQAGEFVRYPGDGTVVIRVQLP